MTVRPATLGIRGSSVSVRTAASWAALAMLVASCGGSTDIESSSIQIGEAVTEEINTSQASSDSEAEEPALLSGTFETMSGGEIDLGSLESQDVVLWFWDPG